MVCSVRGRPNKAFVPKLVVTPVRVETRPVINCARDGVQRGNVCMSVKATPDAASASSDAVSLVEGFRKPASPLRRAKKKEDEVVAAGV